jgi:hypothetical protein
VCLIAGVLTVGCRTIRPENVEAFSTGVSGARAQTLLAFQGVTDLTSPAIIDYAASRPTLSDGNFFVVLDPESVAAWEQVFSTLEKYSQHLALLTSRDLTKEFKDSAVELAQQVQDTGKQLQNAHLIEQAPEVSASIATGLTKIGDLLLKAKAQSEARVIVQQADPAIGKVFAEMAEVVGANRTTGIRGTIFEHWEQIKGRTKVDFVKAVAEHDEARRRNLAMQYAHEMNQQQAQDLVLASLRRSFLALADAHHALANGDEVGVGAAIAIVSDEVRDTRSLYDKFKAATKDDKK